MKSSRAERQKAELHRESAPESERGSEPAGLSREAPEGDAPWGGPSEGSPGGLHTALAGVPPERESHS